ncbi:regulator of G-protein signaling 3-like, partial [Scomber scombrus]
MFWKNTAWSWDDAAGNDDDDGGYLLAADLRRTPDSAPDTDVNCINNTTLTTAVKNNQSTTSTTTAATGLGDFMNQGLTASRPLSFGPTNPNYSSYISTLYTNQQPAAPDSSSTHKLTATGRKLLPHPAHSKRGRHRRGQGSGVRSSLGALGSLWRDRKEENHNLENLEDHNLEDCRPPTTLKGTRVTSSNGDNYIILSPVDPGGQLLQPVYHDRNGTIGRLYQTHPNRGQNLLHDPRPASSQQLFTSHTTTLPPAPPSTSTSPSPPSNYGNYQNCTIVQSHLPCSGYGTYVTPAPKTLIFPVFVQPLDLCSPDRTLLLSEEMILHQADLLPAKVTVLIYTDLLLLTREDEAGHCNVLQSPLYLNTLQLREVALEPLHLYLLQNSHSCCRCLFSLEAFSMEQKLRVSLCLHDNIQQQLVATETGHSQQ